jgi:hypothetical protein
MLKDKVYCNNPGTENNMKKSIQNAVFNFTSTTSTCNEQVYLLHVTYVCKPTATFLNIVDKNSMRIITYWTKTFQHLPPMWWNTANCSYNI